MNIFSLEISLNFFILAEIFVYVDCFIETIKPQDDLLHVYGYCKVTI